MELGKGKDLVILGVGNLLMHDDGVGIHAVKELQKMDLDTSRVDIIDGGTSGVEVLAHIIPERLIIIDAVQANGKPGTIFKFKPEDIDDVREKEQAMSLHDIGLITSIKMVGLIDRKLDATIFGVIPQRYDGWSMELTEEVAACMPRLLDLVLDEAESILGSPIRR